jgi:hypothetical protein
MEVNAYLKLSSAYLTANEECILDIWCGCDKIEKCSKISVDVLLYLFLLMCFSIAAVQKLVQTEVIFLWSVKMQQIKLLW